jgi:hypothetical protein
VATNFVQSWAKTLKDFDVFFDAFANVLIFHREGYFILWEEFERKKKVNSPKTLHLFSNYPEILACAIHPSR